MACMTSVQLFSMVQK